MQHSDKRLIPTGDCWCGCGEETGRGSFFKPGHDKTAESNLITMKYGSVAGFLRELGYGPDGRNLHDDFRAWLDAGNERNK